eukprot:461552-Prorocentrum_minimum.AAC.1
MGDTYLGSRQAADTAVMQQIWHRALLEQVCEGANGLMKGLRKVPGEAGGGGGGAEAEGVPHLDPIRLFSVGVFGVIWSRVLLLVDKHCGRGRRHQFVALLRLFLLARA